MLAKTKISVKNVDALKALGSVNSFAQIGLQALV